MAGIRVRSNVIKIEVNDNGDFISLRKDAEFVNALVRFNEGYQKMAKAFQQEYSKIDKSDIKKINDLVYAFSKQLHDDFDDLFGEDACKKVFGEGIKDVLPSADAVADFFTQLTPYIKNLKQEVDNATPRLSVVENKEGSTGNSYKGYFDSLI